MTAAEGACVVSAIFKKSAAKKPAVKIQKAGGLRNFQYADLTDERQCAAVVDAQP